jgi:outer membrane protein assembly factor BamB
VIAGGRVFAVTDGGVLHVLDLRNGARMWTRSIGVYHGTLTYDGGRIYVTDGRGFLMAHDAASGLVLWSRFVTSDGPPVAADGRVYLAYSIVLDGATGEVLSDRVLEHNGGSMPVVDAQRVYFATECRGAAAVTRTNPRVDWRGPPGPCTSDHGGVPSVVYGGRLYNPNPFHTDESELGYIHDASNGSVVGRFPVGATPAFGGGQGLFVRDGTLTARSAATGLETWTFAGDGQLFLPPVTAGRLAYVASGAGKVFAVDLATGEEIGRATIGAAPRYSVSGLSGIAVAQKTLVAPSATGLVALREAASPPQPGPDDTTPAAVDPGPPAPAPGATTNLHVDAGHTGAINLSEPAAPLRRRWSVPAYPTMALVADGRVFSVEKVPPSSARVRALSTETGATLWSFDLPGFAQATAAYDRGRVFVVHRTGVTALNAATGAVEWRVPRDDVFLRQPPTAIDGELYVNFGRVVTRFDQATGDPVWSSTLPEHTHRAVSVDATRVFAPSACAPLSRETGTPLPTDTRCTFSEYPVAPLYRGHLLEAPAAPTIYDLDADRGIFTVSVGSSTPPAVIGNVAVTTGNGVRAYEFPNWTPRWHYEEPDHGSSAAMPPLIVGSTVYYVNTGGLIAALDLATGIPLWSDRPAGYLGDYDEISPQSLAVGEGLLVAPMQGKIVAYERG